MLGLNHKQNSIFCIDFGLAKRYKDPKSGLHIGLKKRLGVVGT